MAVAGPRGRCVFGGDSEVTAKIRDDFRDLDRAPSHAIVIVNLVGSIVNDYLLQYVGCRRSST